MSTPKDDRILWIAIGVGLFAAYHFIPWQLRHMRQLTEVKQRRDPSHDEDPPKGKADDSLRINSLKTLALSPNFDQRAATIKIIAERSSKDLTRDLLLRDIAGNDSDARDKALVALKFLLSSPLIHRTSNTIPQRFYGYETFRALVDCLVKFLPQHNAVSTKAKQPAPYISAVSPIHPPHRPYHERTAIEILNAVIHNNLPDALRAGVVSKWLSKYPFPCADPANPGRRQDVQELCDSWWQDDHVMSEIVRFISRDTVGRIQLRQHGLMAATLLAEHDSVADGGNENVSLSDTSSEEDIRMGDGDDTAGLVTQQDQLTTPRPGTSHGQPRPRDGGAESIEEQNIRHRRREAIVISDGTGPLRRENIIEPNLERDGRPPSRGNNTASAEQNESSPASSPAMARPTFMAFGPNNTIIVGEDVEEAVRGSDQNNPVREEGQLAWDAVFSRVGVRGGNQEPVMAEGVASAEPGNYEDRGGRSRRQSLGWVDWVRERWRFGVDLS